ncbi:calcium-binding protein E63-1-like [Oppia nitens]|uniref:calcium-binding protein E63-1-like n=1 Tax=Oppia nitens TaxID=1686743 RepID=UPI0023DB568E|nr:calcium-binding protein E63-1-like [Oppia nitens]
MSKKATSSKSSNKSTKLKPIDETQLKTAFQMFDMNRDGKVNEEEMKSMLNKLGIQINDNLVKQMIASASKNGDGLITESEFLIWLSKIKTHKDNDVEEDLKAAFSVFDSDKNGFITRDELKSAMQLIGETITDRDLDQLLNATDIDKDGKINYEEFIKCLL